MISVIICTYNRCKLLSLALDSVCEQTIDKSGYEVIVVDNHSTDETSAIARSFCANHSNVRYVFEPVQGLSVARNRGWREAIGEYVAYIDDDCKVPPDWLKNAQNVIETVAPVEFGGPSFAYHIDTTPVWWKPEYDSDHTLDATSPLGWLPPEREIYGLNLFMRRSVFSLVGGFDSNFGVRGQTLVYGEESEMHARICRFVPGHRAYFDPSLYVYHLVRPIKLSPWWRLESSYKHGHARYRIEPNRQHALSSLQCLVFSFYVLLVLVFTFLMSFLWRDERRFPRWQNFLYESKHLYACVRHLGSLSAAVTTYWMRKWRRLQSYVA